MSRAFVKEDGPDNTPLPDLPVSAHPNYVTLRGLAQLQAALAEAQARLGTLRARAERLDRLPEAAAERDIRYFETRLKTAIPILPDPQACDAVRFGHVIDVIDADGVPAQYQIVGEDEADAAQGLISAHAPLGRALIGAQSGDVVIWRRPAGNVELEITGISWP